MIEITQTEILGLVVTIARLTNALKATEGLLEEERAKNAVLMAREVNGPFRVIGGEK